MPESDKDALVAQVLSSYLSNNTVSAADLPEVIESVKRAFSGSPLSIEPSLHVDGQKTWERVVPIKRSVALDAGLFNALTEGH
jgi:predicted transcriptional regulator